MNKANFKEELNKLLSTPVDGLSVEEKIAYVKDLLIIYQRANEDSWDTSNKGKPWSDDELRIILQNAPTKENCVLFAKAFKRGYGSIEQIYRWAVTPHQTIAEKRPDDAFIKQIKKIAKEVGIRA